jgi:hypothetical protein
MEVSNSLLSIRLQQLKEITKICVTATGSRIRNSANQSIVTFGRHVLRVSHTSMPTALPRGATHFATPSLVSSHVDITVTDILLEGILSIPTVSDVRWKIFHIKFSRSENFPENFPQYFSRKFSVS